MDIQFSQNINKHVIPNIIHFLPGCDKYETSWKKLNNEFVILKWDADSIAGVLKNTEKIKDLHLDFVKDNLAIASTLCYHFGGIVITKPENCFQQLHSLLGNLPTTLLATFALADTQIDDSILISAPKIGAFTSLFEYFVQAKQQSKSIKTVFSDFIQTSMQASNPMAIVCLHQNVKEKLTKKPQEEFMSILSPHLPNTTEYFQIIQPSELSSRIKPWLESLGKCDIIYSANTNVKVGILVIDMEKFDMEAPISAAIEAVLAFQNVNLSQDAVIVVAHSPSGGISLDMMMIPQLHHLKAKEIYRTDHAAWKIDYKGSSPSLC
jgi:hypothetical protein